MFPFIYNLKYTTETIITSYMYTLEYKNACAYFVLFGTCSLGWA